MAWEVDVLNVSSYAESLNFSDEKIFPGEYFAQNVILGSKVN